jgi:hypothetical protein
MPSNRGESLLGTNRDDGRRMRNRDFACLVLLASLSSVMTACGGVAFSDAPDQPAPSGPPPGAQPSGPTPVACALPASPTVATLATGVALQSSLATNTASVFWSEGIGGATVMRAPKVGGGAASTIPGATGRVAAADDAAVYVVTGAGNAADFGIVRLPLDGGAPTTIVAGSTAITAVAIDDARIYWAASGASGDCFSDSCPTPTPSLTSAPKSGGATTALGAFGASYLRVDGNLVYFANQVASDVPLPKTSIGAIPKTGGAAVALVSRPGAAISDVELDGTNLYWTESDLTDTVPPAVMTVPKSGGAPVTVATLATRDPQRIALDVASVYWLDDQTQSLMRAPKSGGAPAVVIGDQVTAVKFGGFGALAADGAGLYWVADVACGPSCTGKVVALPASCH